MRKEWSSEMNFLDEQRWSGKIFTGEWTAADGGTIPVVEPATGIEIGAVGEASPGDLQRSVARARQAQAEWAAVSFTERAAVMRRAAELWTQHSAEVHNWLMREAGGIRLKAQYEVYGAVQECLESSGCPLTRWARFCLLTARS
jgi:benzaldehyde dehydrogenase (NAD)